MDFTTPPAAREQFTEFLQCSLDVLRQIYVCVRIQRGMALLYEKIADGMDPAESMGLQKQMIPDVVEQDRKIKEILASPEGQYMLTYLPLRYCRMDTILWLRRRYRKCAFAGMESAFRASDGSISLFFCRMGKLRRNGKNISVYGIYWKCGWKIIRFRRGDLDNRSKIWYAERVPYLFSQRRQT